MWQKSGALTYSRWRNGWLEPFFLDVLLVYPNCEKNRDSHRRKQMRRADKRIYQGIERGEPFEIQVDGETVLAYEGETIGAALVAAGLKTIRHTRKQQPRGLYCGIGLCQECRMVIDGVPNTQACQTPATPGCRVESQHDNRSIQE